MDRLPPGVGAAPERPPQGPVASLGVGLERLRQLGWTRSDFYDRTYRLFRTIDVALMVALVGVVLILEDRVALLVVCIPVWLVMFLILLLVAYYYRTLARRTRGMLTRRVTAPRGAELRNAAEAAIAAVWFQHQPSEHRAEPTLAKHMLVGSFHVFRLPELGAELMVAVQPDTRDEVEASTLLMGPVTADNVGGFVRLAEALERSIGIERAIHRAR